MKLFYMYLIRAFQQRCFFCSLACCFAFSMQAQFIEDFSDGDFINQPEWTGDLDKFIVNKDDELQLSDGGASGSSNSAQIVTEVNTADSTKWEFLVRMDFNPSSANLLRVYLSASTPNLEEDLAAYYVEIGGTNDVVSLYRQSGSSKEKVIEGQLDALDTDMVLVRVKVSRTSEHEWSLLVDYEGEENFELQGTAVDDTHPMGNFFGFWCKYSTTRSDKFFFDDILIEPLFVDVLPPEVVSFEIISATAIDVYFNEVLDENTANDESNYDLNNGVKVAAAELDVITPNLVHLFLDIPMSNLQIYTLLINGVEDGNGNAISNVGLDFTFFDFVLATTFDVIINEIMADPNPPLGLPDAEFVELYNRSDKTINLKNMELASGSNPQLLPEFVLLPDSYVVICDEDKLSLFAPFGDVLGVPSFPALSNDGDEIILTSPEGVLIDAVAYNANWYQSSAKSNGGWTLERIQPQNPCDVSATNWRASENGNGGTPGQANSILDNEVDDAPPEFLRAFPLSPTELQLFFDEALDENTATQLENYELTDALIAIDANLDIPFWNVVTLSLNEPLELNQIYNISVNTNLTDCIENPIEMPNTNRFALAEVLDTMDIVINEILYNPETGGAEFVELYNRSSKNLNIGELVIANRDEEGNINVVRPIPFNYLLFPEEYVVLTENVLDIENRYLSHLLDDPTKPFRSSFLEMDLPTLQNDDGTLVIYKANVPQPLIIDELVYTDDFHYPLLDDTKGVSLERINPNAPTQSSNNWHSASARVNFATPTYQNSQYFISGLTIESSNVFSIANTTFSPDGDGFEDFLLLDYQTEAPGFTANVQIYDAAGRLIRDLVRNELLAVEGSIKWDGTTDARSKARIGIYVIWLEIFHPNGTIEREKKTCVLAARLN